MSHTVTAVWLNVSYLHTRTHSHSQKIAWWESPILSRMLIRSVRSPWSTNSFYPLILSALPPSPSPSLPVSPAPVSADRYLLKIPDCTDNAHKVVECRFPQSKTETRLKNATPTAVSCLIFGIADFSDNPLKLVRKINLLIKLHFFFSFFSPPSLSQKLKLSSKPV